MQALDHGLMLFFETRPTLTREQVKLLQEAGILWIQPGIESLSTRSLRRMKKGVSAGQNVLLLKYAAEYGVGVLWNILYGFAGESASEFEEMAALAPLISHLQAPSIGCHQVRLDRFSPMHTHPETFGLANVKPYPTYGYIFPLNETSLSRMAYYFTYEYGDHAIPETAVAALKAAVASWQNAAGDAALIYVDRGDTVTVCDTRECAVAARYRLAGIDRHVFLACDRGATHQSLQENEALKGSEWERSLADLTARKLLVELDGRYINPAVRMSAEASDEDMLTSYLEEMRLMRYQIDRLKVQSGD
jgi:magnesium-protoporphyrin IX monomethyl ester (oxidative) cyclase